VSDNDDDLTVWRAMKAQVTIERMQELAFVAFRGDDPGQLSEAEQFFFDRAVADVQAHPGAVMMPLDL
jgi:hypothetical protein